MPRVENCGENVRKWNQEVGDPSSTHDVCAGCYFTLMADPHAFDKKLKPYNDDPIGDEGWMGNVEHPCYSDEDYHCEICGKPLGRHDN